MTRLAELEGRTQGIAEYGRAAKNATTAPTRMEDMPESAKAAGKKLPPFTAIGIDGRVWTTADLQGKVAVMSVWATWCGPCVEELMHFQKLDEVLKDRPNVVLISLNIDASPGVVEPFLEGRGLTFPVLLAQEFVNQVVPEMSIPRSWIVESGFVRSEDIGFGDTGPWLERMLAKVEPPLRGERLRYTEGL